jgi:vacuolar-type H+-ATPase subunit E/Vma4
METAAAGEAARQMESARARGEALLESARADVVAARQRSRREAELTVRAEQARLESEARLRAAIEVGNARNSLVHQAFSTAEQALRDAWASEGYPFALKTLLHEALEEFAAGQALVVQCHPRDLSLITRLAADLDRPTSVEASLSGWGGVVVHDATGRIVADDTLERRFQRARELLWPQVARLATMCSAARSSGTGSDRPND